MSLHHVPVPDAGVAEERAWEVVRAAFEARVPEPVSERRRLRPVLVGSAAVLAIVAAALSPPGRAVVREARRAIGIQHAAPGLFRLPTGGRLLATDENGAWVVSADGSKRLLGLYREASWSPHGLYVVAAKTNELVALEPAGRVHWTLSRRSVRFPRWGGSRTDTRIAYLAASRLRVVGGDGTGDHALRGLPPAAPVAPAWGAGDRPDLAYVDRQGHVYRLTRNGTTTRWRSGPHGRPRLLVWSPDGREIALATRRAVFVFDAETGAARTIGLANTAALAFAPHGRLAIVGPDSVRLANRGAKTQLVFAGARSLVGAAWSPDGRWLLLASPAADEWIFIRAGAARRILAVANMRAQFEGFPQPGSWCCAH